MTVKNTDTIKVDYVGTLEDGTVFDTSVETVAKESDNYQEGRPYQPLEFKVGAGQMIKGFDTAVVGMKLDEEKTVTLPPAEAYGEMNEKLVQEIPIDTLKNAGIEPKAGMVISANGNPAKIIKVENNTVTMDFNHELAGKTLIFKITLKEIV
ncbi:MAG: peptidylprolyl isomerase [Candidatus Aenigmarchaeota archaeon]|nr:peptidylprolyl isomerase [Candidatus Aenigmarchaeota archaeon]